MTPTLPIATDNIYKFTCLFGLALIIASIFSFVSIYNASLNQQVKYVEAIIPLEAKEQRSKTDNEFLELNRNLLELTKSNKRSANTFASSLLGVGIALSAFGALLWYGKIQCRDDKLAKLQIEKLEAEIAKLRAENAQMNSKDTVSTTEKENYTNPG